MAEPFIGEVKITFSWNFPPKGWRAFCNGQLFCPSTRTRHYFPFSAPPTAATAASRLACPTSGTHAGARGRWHCILGERGGETAHTLNISELPAPNHVPFHNSGAPTAPAPGGNLWAGNPNNLYSNAQPNSAMNPACILPTGGSQPHENMSPYLVLNFIIALQGTFPSQN